MNLIDGGVVTDVEFDGDVGFATISHGGRNLYVEFPVSYVAKTTCISNAPFNPENYREWTVDFECPIIAGDLVLYSWQGCECDFIEGRVLFDSTVLIEINKMLEVFAAKIELDGVETE